MVMVILGYYFILDSSMIRNAITPLAEKQRQAVEWLKKTISMYTAMIVPIVKRL